MKLNKTKILIVVIAPSKWQKRAVNLKVECYELSNMKTERKRQKRNKT